MEDHLSILTQHDHRQVQPTQKQSLSKLVPMARIRLRVTLL